MDRIQYSFSKTRKFDQIRSSGSNAKQILRRACLKSSVNDSSGPGNPCYFFTRWFSSTGTANFFIFAISLNYPTSALYTGCNLEYGLPRCHWNLCANDSNGPGNPCYFFPRRFSSTGTADFFIFEFLGFLLSLRDIIRCDDTDWATVWWRATSVLYVNCGGGLGTLLLPLTMQSLRTYSQNSPTTTPLSHPHHHSLSSPLSLPLPWTIKLLSTRASTFAPIC